MTATGKPEGIIGAVAMTTPVTQHESYFLRLGRLSLGRRMATGSAAVRMDRSFVWWSAVGSPWRNPTVRTVELSTAAPFSCSRISLAVTT
jgi:hypothetical protein